VLLAIAESQGIQPDLIPRIATGFCSGISRTGGMCGAVRNSRAESSVLSLSDRSEINIQRLLKQRQEWITCSIVVIRMT
jgi:dihydrofolate reductase